MSDPSPGISSRQRWTLWGLVGGSIIAFGLIGLLITVHFSSQPSFCGSCHVMAPYYDSWRTSSHSEIACTQCHIAPGVYSEIEKKTEAVSMVVSYFTGTYGTNPWAEVDDVACLQCHSRRLLAGREVFGDVLFDHSPHLTEMRGGKQLRCTSCHSQIVQGSHIKVTTSTCILCHFKDEQVGQGLSDCTKCHSVPDRVVEKGSLTFDHGDVKRFDMDCAWCHASVTKGDGSAPRNRCYVCHNDESRLASYDDHEKIHQIHVTDHKVECLHCHTEIQHGTFGERHEVAQTECNSCHSGGHSPQRDLFVGIGGKGAEPRPSNMHLAGIRCEGCHLFDTEKGKGAGFVKLANEVSCMACHGPGYNNILTGWQEMAETRIGQARRQLAMAEDRLGAQHPAVTDAEANLAMVETGRAVHNIDYALDILWANHEMFNAAASSAGVAALSPPCQKISYEIDCLRCHQGAALQTGHWEGKRFAHERHVIDQKLECTTCHRPHDERSRAEIVSISVAQCQSCHHNEKADFADDCSSCHSVGERIVKVDVAWGEDFDHAYHIDDEGFECADCHAAEVDVQVDTAMCLDCHE